MPSIIRVLDEITINKIAAGEVIENPASVVKELVENAVDAGATEITVEVKGGGRQLIRVSDNGCGMGRDDALLSFERHATSKIRDIEDIHSIATMGFRGEAVPSIAAISKLTLLTCKEGEEEGTLVIVDGGRIVKCAPAAKSQGTTFEVKSLFFNVPVRKKFQRSPAYDSNEVLKIVTMQALAHPEIKFEMINNNKTSLSTALPRSEKAIERYGERISDVLGREFFLGLCPLEREHNGYKLLGYCGLPTFTRHNRTGQYLFINNRAVFSPLVSFAVKDAYGTSLASNRHPVFVLYLTMEGALVDVNVHPQKREVRLRQEYRLRETIALAIEEALHNTGGCYFAESSTFPEPSTVPIQPSFTPPEPPFQQEAPEDSMSGTKSTFLDIFEKIDEPRIDPLPLFTHGETEPGKPTPSRAIAAVPGYIILLSSEGTLQLLDQRAAHAKILFEKLSNSNSRNNLLPVQNLLIPLTLDLPPNEAAILRENIDYLFDLGLQIEDFGSNSFIVHSVPQIFDEARAENIIIEIVHELGQFDNEVVVKHEKQKKIAQAAGRAAISPAKKLTVLEGQNLYHQLIKCKSPYRCPLGNPTIIELTQEDIAKQFRN